jgi:phenylalanyl-tRNA synthetase, alpha subunit
MHPEIERLQSEIRKDLEGITNTKDIETLKVKYLGRKGPIQALMPLLKTVNPEDRPLFGKEINDIKTLIETQLEEKASLFLKKELTEQLSQENIDITLPGRQNYAGRKHPLTDALDQILNILIGMGFSVQYGPDIDTDYYNFEVLNFAPDHPARDEHDTFYISDKVLLRTHTSNVQARVMEQTKPPIRVIVPGKCYRNETITARSHVQFHQVEGFYIDKGVTLSDLISTLDHFLTQLFGEEVKTRYRTSYFPFVEPGLEVDVSCMLCRQEGCSVCKYTGWLEILGAGMIHPEVLKNCGIDPEVYSGFAWGMGLERLVMQQRGIRDIRIFQENDLRFLQQFPGI